MLKPGQIGDILPKPKLAGDDAGSRLPGQIAAAAKSLVDKDALSKPPANGDAIPEGPKPGDEKLPEKP